MKTAKSGRFKFTTRAIVSAAALALLLSFTTNASAVSKIARMRCQVDSGIDLLGNPYKQVQIQVKIKGPDMLDVWVVNPTHSSGFPAVSPMHTMVPSIGGTVSVDWDSFPDPDPLTGLIPAGVMIISQDFVTDGESIVAHARYVTTLQEIVTEIAPCATKIPAQFKQQTKPTAAEKAAAKAAKLAAKPQKPTKPAKAVKPPKPAKPAKQTAAEKAAAKLAKKAAQNQTP